MVKLVISAAGIALLSNATMATMAFDIGIILAYLDVKIGKDIAIISTTVFLLTVLFKGAVR